MDAGLAKAFKSKYPEMFNQYRQHCRRGLVKPGSVILYDTPDGRTVANLPNKNDWRHPSRLEYISSGLQALNSELALRGATSAAVPAIGTGLCGLN